MSLLFVFIFEHISLSHTHEEHFHPGLFFDSDRPNKAVVGDMPSLTAPKTASLIHISWLSEMNAFWRTCIELPQGQDGPVLFPKHTRAHAHNYLVTS